MICAGGPSRAGAAALALAAMAVERGASILRVHDVAATVDAVNMAWAVLQEGCELPLNQEQDA